MKLKYANHMQYPSQYPVRCHGEVLPSRLLNNEKIRTIIVSKMNTSKSDKKTATRQIMRDDMKIRNFFKNFVGIALL
jgi:hypothetical protein